MLLRVLSAQHACILSRAAVGDFRCLHGRVLSSLRWDSSDTSVELASTLPANWYTEPEALLLEKTKIFHKAWQCVGHLGQLQKPGDFFTGSVLNAKYLVCKTESGDISAFHNVCRHHAAAVAEGCGNQSCFVCPYHGWTYGLDGRLRQASRMKGVKNFKARHMGLVPIRVESWGPFLFIAMDKDADDLPTISEWLGPGGQAALDGGVNDGLVHVAQREYHIACNWKVFCDNYLDGGYHVEHAHKALAGGLDLSSYRVEVQDRVSLQTCHMSSKGDQEPAEALSRLQGGRSAMYAFLYPNLMINRYGPWMDTNLVLPVTHTSTMVRFDYFLDPKLAADFKFVEQSLVESNQVQQEDIQLCTAVQQGLQSPAYATGRYSPALEAPMFRFHQLVYNDIFGGTHVSVPSAGVQ